MITREQVEKLSNLARIKLSSEEKESLCRDMDSILGYVEEVKTAPDNSDADRASQSVNVMREESGPDLSGVFSDILAREMPESESGYLKVKKIL